MPRNPIASISLGLLFRITVGWLAGVLGACSSPHTKPAAIEHAPPQIKVPIDQPVPGPTAREPIIVRGTGVLTGTPEASDAPTRTSDGYQFNFVDTEISAVVASVVGDGLGMPYTVDPKVRGTMTLQATRPLSRSDLLPALEAALEVNGAGLINMNGTIQVVPLQEATKHVGTLRTVSSGDRAAGFAVQVVPLKYVSAQEMEKALRPFAPDGGIVRVDEGRNLLVLAGTSRELGLMRDAISTFDVNWLAGMSFALYPVEYVDAKTIADELGNIFSDTKSPIANVVKLVPLTRLNSVMVVTHEPSYLAEVESWIKRLDIGAATPGRRIYVYDVQNGKADDLATSLGRILSIPVEVSQSSGYGSMRSTFESSRTSGSALLGGAGSLGANSYGPSRQESQPSVQPHAEAVTGEAGALKIVPNPENNAVLIYATPSEFTVIESALKRLDVVPIQVMIEASLAEVTLTDDIKYGLQWAYQSGNGPIVLSEASNGSINPAFPGFSYLYTARADIRAVLNAIENITDVKVISSPKLLVLNNREAELQIGDQVPITVQSAVSTVGETAPIVNSVQLRDTGVILRITPRANKSGLVLLDVAQEVSDVVPTTTSNIDSPTIQQRRIASTVAVRNGETIALGGLIRDSKSRSRGGIPFLRKIPIIGDLFGSTGHNNRRTELIVLITPRVLRSQQESEEMMEDLRDQFRGLQKVLPGWRNLPASAPQASSATPAQ